MLLAKPGFLFGPNSMQVHGPLLPVTFTEAPSGSLPSTGDASSGLAWTSMSAGPPIALETLTPFITIGST